MDLELHSFNLTTLSYKLFMGNKDSYRLTMFILVFGRAMTFPLTWTIVFGGASKNFCSNCKMVD